jgi:cell pole-organizing protein PopZ
MTKPQFSTEPSMEDILASIRKMISEERLGPRPIPDQIGRSPFGESVAETPAVGPIAVEPRFERAPAPAERAPSFSSLSDALKAATPSPEQRLSLEEKIADMLENGEASPRPATPADSLAVFAATRLTPATSPDLGPLSTTPRSPDAASERPTARKTPGPGELSRTAKPASRPSEAPLNGSAHRREERAPRPGGAPKTEPKVADAKNAEAMNIDTQRIIAMPPRPGAPASAANGAGQPGASSPAATATNGAHGQDLNGASVASLGLHAFPGSAPVLRTALREADAPSDRSLDAETGAGLTAKSYDGTKSSEGSMRSRSDDRLADDRAKGAGEPRRETAAKPMSAPTARTTGEVDKTVEPSSGTGPVTARSTPSDALLDAVVALVHKEPDTLSVFTSGSAFIHGVTGEEPVRKPGPNMGRKLDRSAAELLRPMLRQWLSDNMPRIVEDALRSELMSSQPEPKDSDEA